LAIGVEVNKNKSIVVTYPSDTHFLSSSVNHLFQEFEGVLIFKVLNLKNSEGLVFSGRRQPAITALAEIRGFLVHQKTISQCGGLPGPFSTAEASLILANGNLTDSMKRLPDKSKLLSLPTLELATLILPSPEP
jgi:hypothetical protein